jgi:hypothetical protein
MTTRQQLGVTPAGIALAVLIIVGLVLGAWAGGTCF